MPRWFDELRQLTLFLLGVAVTVDALTTAGPNVALLAAGLVLLGLAPVDRFLSRKADGAPR